MRKILLALMIFGFVTTQAQFNPVPPGCWDYTVLDYDNDGIATFDIPAFKAYAFAFVSGMTSFNIENSYSMNVFSVSTQQEYTESFTSTDAVGDFMNANCTYAGPGPVYVPNVYYLGLNYFHCFYFQTAAFDADEDGDGILNVDEDANGDGILQNDDTDGDGTANFLDADLNVQNPRFSDVNIYPNPASDVVSVVGTDAALSISIFDLNGRKLKQTEGTHAIELSDLQPGVYVVEISSAEKRKAFRVVKQ